MLSTTRTAAFTAAALGVSLCLLPAQSPRADVNHDLGLSGSEIVEVYLLSQPDGQVYATMRQRERWTTMSLKRHSVRAPGFQILAQGGDGSWRRVDPGPVPTLRGHFVEQPNARVAGALLDDGLYAYIAFGDDQDFWLQPLLRNSEPVDHLYVLYRDEDVVDGKHPCGADLIPGNRSVVPQGVFLDGGGLRIAELGCDADFEYFQDYGSVTAVGDRIQAVINTMNMQYENQVDIRHQITTILVRTSSNQPYTSTDAVTLLNQFRNEWLSNQGGIQRDVAQLFTGKDVNGGTIGIAWIGAVCTSFGFGVVESDFNNNFSCATDLSAHELGHNWNAPHCSCTSFTMNPFITCANNFSAGTISTISAFRDSRTCLGTGAPQNQAPSVDAGPNQTVTLPASANLNGTVSDDGLPNPPGQVTTTWSQVSGPGSVTFGNPSAVDTTASFSTAGSYVLRLTADDSSLTTSDTVTITVNPAGGVPGTLAFDDFESASGSGGFGWSDVWRGSGDVRLTTTGGPHSGSWHLRLRRSTGLAQREVNLSGVSNASLVFWARLRSFESSDRALVRVSTNGGSSFTTVLTFRNGDDDNIYHRYEIPLTSVSSRTVIRFDAEMSSSADYFYVDDVEIVGIR